MSANKNSSKISVHDISRILKGSALMKPYVGYKRIHGCSICKLFHAQYSCPTLMGNTWHDCPTLYKKNFCYNCIGSIPFIDYFA